MYFLFGFVSSLPNACVCSFFVDPTRFWEGMLFMSAATAFLHEIWSLSQRQRRDFALQSNRQNCCGGQFKPAQGEAANGRKLVSWPRIFWPISASSADLPMSTCVNFRHFPNLLLPETLRAGEILDTDLSELIDKLTNSHCVRPQKRKGAFIRGISAHPSYQYPGAQYICGASPSFREGRLKGGDWSRITQ